MPRLPPFKDATLDGMCKLLGEVVTGSEISAILARRGLPDPGGPGLTKWKRLVLSVSECQQRHGVGNHAVQLIMAIMDPARWTHEGQAAFEDTRAKVNVLLAFEGYELGQDGKLRHSTAAETLADAEARAGRLRSELSRRRVHPDVLSACRAELLKDNCFHAVLEATKSVAAKIRMRTGLTGDGNSLITAAFGQSGGKPRLAFNALSTPSERSEHEGLVNMMKGVVSAFRNPTAHELKQEWPIDEADALDLLSTLSFLHRRLDAATS